jgi:glycosyltransferase involved in cell wall biosynthesis
LASGGSERQLVNMARGLRQRGIDDVHILIEHLSDSPAHAFHLPAAREVAASVSEPRVASGDAEEVVRRFPALFAVVGRHLGQRILAIAEHLREIRPEIVHASLDWTNATVGIAAAMIGVPRIVLSGRSVAPWHFEFFSWFLYPAYRALLTLPNVRLLNNSDSGARDYARWLRIPRERISVLRNSFDRSAFPPMTTEARAAARGSFHLPPEAPVVAGAFRFSEEKRPALWLEAAARLYRNDPRAHFLLCGEGPLRAEMEAYARALGLGGNTRFLGVIDKVSPVYAAADVVLLTSRVEGSPNVLLEAQAMGIPVVTTHAFGAAEVVEDGMTGRVVINDTPEALAKALSNILGDPGFRARAAAEGPLFIERKFGLERMIDDTLELYSQAGATWAERYLSINRSAQATPERRESPTADIASSRPAPHAPPSAREWARD